MKFIFFFVFFWNSLISQNSLIEFDDRRILIQNSNMRDFKSLNENGVSYLYSEMSFKTDSIDKKIEINGQIFNSFKHKRTIWISKINAEGDTLFTKIIHNIPNFNSIYSSLVKNDILYFIVSNVYHDNGKEREGCVFISYNCATNSIISRQIKEKPYLYGDKILFTKNDKKFYLLVDDNPHHCLPPEQNVNVLQINYNGEIIKKSVLEKTICKSGIYTPEFLYQSNRYFYLNSGLLFKQKTKNKNICALNIEDVFENKKIPYAYFQHIISIYNTQTLKLNRKITIDCNHKVIGLLNDSIVVMENIGINEKNKKVLVFKNLKRQSQILELDVKTKDWSYFKIVNHELYVMGIANNEINVQRINSDAEIINEINFSFIDNKQNTLIEVIPIRSNNKIRYFYKRDLIDFTSEIGYFEW